MARVTGGNGEVMPRNWRTERKLSSPARRVGFLNLLFYPSSPAIQLVDLFISWISRAARSATRRCPPQSSKGRSFSASLGRILLLFCDSVCLVLFLCLRTLELGGLFRLYRHFTIDGVVCRHANGHFEDEETARDVELALQIALAPPSPPTTLVLQSIRP